MNELKLIYQKADLCRILEKESVVIYGAGMVANVVISYLIRNGYSNHIFCVAVTDKEENPDEILGVPVCSLKDIMAQCRNSKIIISTLEKKHDEIYHVLQQAFPNVCAVSNILYADLRQENPSFDFEILQNIKSHRNVEKQIRQILVGITHINNELRKMKRCMQYNTAWYDETLEKPQYYHRLKEWYKSCTGRDLDLENPKTFNEKIQWIKLYGVTPLMTQLTDKYLVRDWVAEKIGSKYLTRLLGVWNDFDTIDFNSLPDKFVLKCNHGCGYNIVVKSKVDFNKDEARKKFKRWLNTNYAFTGGLELQYKDIEPLIIAEEYMENEDKDLFDYKFWCFDGKVEFIMFLSERNKKLKMNNFDREWNELPFTYDYERSIRKINKPRNLSKMIQIAEILAQGFSHVRVDLYLLNNEEIKFGEMTFTSDSGVCKWSDEKINIKLGKLIKLNEGE